MANPPPVCLDSCVIISYLKGGLDRNPADVPLLKGFFGDVYSGNVHVIFPTLLRGELLECNLTAKLMEQFEQLTALDNFDEIPINSRISKLVAEIRNFYKLERKRNTSIPMISLADAVFIATAIEENCPRLFTYDGDREPPSKPCKLLSLVNPIAGKYALDIQKPNAFQLGI